MSSPLFLAIALAAAPADTFAPVAMRVPPPPIAAPVVVAPVAGGPLITSRFEAVVPRPTPSVQGDGASAPEALPAPEAVEYSDWYYRRLTVHRWASYTILPLFAAQFVAGLELAKGEAAAADWAEDAHPMLAAGVAGLFGVNTLTGVWNLWDSRKDPEGRGRRITHAALMLLADAGFVATGILADDAEDDGGAVGPHRTMAISSMAVATISWAMMLDIFR